MTDTEAFAPEKNLAITQGKVVYRNRLTERGTAAVHSAVDQQVLHSQPAAPRIVSSASSSSMASRYSNDQLENPDASMQGIAFEDYMTDGPLTASDAVREIMETQLRVGLRQRPPEKRLEITTIRRQKAQQSGSGFGADPI
jgi:polyhydroxyalkanoate synthase